MIWFIFAIGVAVVAAVKAPKYDRAFTFFVASILGCAVAALVGLMFGSSEVGIKWDTSMSSPIEGNVTLDFVNEENFYVFTTEKTEKVSIEPDRAIVRLDSDARYEERVAKNSEWWTGLVRPFNLLAEKRDIYVPADRFVLTH